jgi:hypothetical protein
MADEEEGAGVAWLFGERNRRRSKRTKGNRKLEKEEKNEEGMKRKKQGKRGKERKGKKEELTEPGWSALPGPSMRLKEEPRNLLQSLKPQKMQNTNANPEGPLSDIKLIRTDTTLDHSQSAEKQRRSFFLFVAAKRCSRIFIVGQQGIPRVWDSPSSLIFGFS